MPLSTLLLKSRVDYFTLKSRHMQETVSWIETYFIFFYIFIPGPLLYLPPSPNVPDTSNVSNHARCFIDFGIMTGYDCEFFVSDDRVRTCLVLRRGSNVSIPLPSDDSNGTRVSTGQDVSTQSWDFQNWIPSLLSHSCTFVICKLHNRTSEFNVYNQIICLMWRF